MEAGEKGWLSGKGHAQALVWFVAFVTLGLPLPSPCVTSNGIALVCTFLFAGVQTETCTMERALSLRVYGVSHAV